MDLQVSYFWLPNRIKLIRVTTDNGWLSANPIPDAKAIWGVGEQVDQQNKVCRNFCIVLLFQLTSIRLMQRLVQSILAEAPSSTLPVADQRNLETLRTFYGSCMADTALEKEGEKPLVDMVKHLVNIWRGKKQTSFQIQSADGRWDPETRKERLTSTLLYLHSRCQSFLHSSTVEFSNLHDYFVQFADDAMCRRTLPLRPLSRR